MGRGRQGQRSAPEPPATGMQPFLWTQVRLYRMFRLLTFEIFVYEKQLRPQECPHSSVSAALRISPITLAPVSQAI